MEALLCLQYDPDLTLTYIYKPDIFDSIGYLIPYPGWVTQKRMSEDVWGCLYIYHFRHGVVKVVNIIIIIWFGWTGSLFRWSPQITTATFFLLFDFSYSVFFLPGPGTWVPYILLPLYIWVKRAVPVPCWRHYNTTGPEERLYPYELL